MLYYIAYCLYIFFIVLQIDVLLYLLKNILPGAGWFKYFVEMLAVPVLSPIQKLVKHSVLKCFRTDISPYILLIVLFYLESLCSYIMEH
ncbi:MAG: YggT family protein [Lachnospiraceae bacterium]